MQQIGLDAELKGVPDFTGGIEKMNKAVDAFASGTAKSLDKAAGLTQDAAGRWRTATGRFASDAEKAAAGVETIGPAAKGAGKAADDAGSHFSAFGEIVTGALRKIGELSVQALLQAGRAVTGFVTDSIGLAGDFEAGMLQFQSVAGKGVDTTGLAEFRDLFLDIGKRLPVSTADVQQAAIEMVKGGIDPATIAAGGLEQNIQFAAAAMGGDLVKAAEISSKILGGWAGINATAAEKADFLTHSTDMLARAANASTTDVEGLSRGIFNAQGVAKTAGVSFDDLVTTMAELAPRFASSSEAGNSLKNMIVRLQPTTDPATQAMSALGLYTEQAGSAFYDAQGNFVGFQQASELLKQSLQGLTKEQQAAALQTIFGNDAMGSAAALAEMGAQGYQQMADALVNANGVQAAAALTQQGYNTALDNAKGSVEALQITIGSYLLPVLTDLLNNTIAPAVNAFTDWATAILGADDPLQALVTSIDAAVPGFTAFLDTADDLFTLLSDNIAIVEGVAAALGTLVILSTVAGWVSGAVAAVASLGAAFTAAGGGIAGVVAILGGPVTLAIAGVAAAVGLLTVAWQQNWGDIQGKTAAVWATVEPIFDGAVAWLQDEIPKALDKLSDVWTGTLLPAVKTVGAFFENTVFPILGDLADVWLAAASVEVDALAALWTNILWPALKAVGSFITTVLAPIFVALFEVEFAIASKVVEALAGLWQKVLWPALQSVGNYITTTVLPAFTSIGTYLSATFGPILTSVTGWLDKVTGGFGGVSGAVDFVVGKIHEFAAAISNLKLPDWLTPGSPTPWEIALYGIGNALQKSVAPGLSAMQRGVSEIGAQIDDAFTDSDLVDTLSNLAEDAMAGFGQGLKSATRGVISVINSTADTVEGAFKDAFDAHSPAQRMVPIGESVTQGVLEGIVSGWDGLTAQVGSLADDLIDSMRDIGSQIQGVIADSFNATASIDRQMAKNLDRFKDILPQYQQYTSGALDEALKQAQSFLDPAEGAKFYKMRSDQILEYAKLQKDLDEAETQADRDRISQQMLLINAAQSAELGGFNANQTAQQNATEQIATSINDVMKAIAGINLTDDQIKIVDMLSSVWGQLQTPVNTRADAYAHPTTTMSSTTNLNMPIYTNQSPAVLQASMAIAGAALV